MGINFYSIDIDFDFENSNFTGNTIEKIISDEKKCLGEINIIFVSDKYLIEINRNFLKHNYYTDVITFANNKKDVISGDIYISIETVNKNSIKFGAKQERLEILRVIFHGVLHLVGYDDKSESEKKVMRSKEELYLNLLETE